MTSTVFVSYRRETGAGSAGRLYDALVAQLGQNSIFIDVDNIPPGENFVQILNDTLAKCRAIIVVIDREWLRIADQHGRRRLDNPRDFVRLEIEGALRHGARIFPVLVDGAIMPSPEDLPPTIRELADRQAVEISASRFRYDAGRLIDAIMRVAGPIVDEGRPGLSSDGPAGPSSGAESSFLHPDFKLVYALSSRQIRAVPEVVWNVLVDVPRYPTNVPTVVEVRPLSSGPIGKGYRYLQVHKLIGIRLEVHYEIVEFEPPHRVSFAAGDTDGKIAQGLNRYTLDGSGPTRVSSMAYQGTTGWILDRLLSKRMEGRWLENVATVAELEQQQLGS